MPGERFGRFFVTGPHMARDEWFICAVGLVVLLSATVIASLSAFALQ
jgi:hypothetical protein